MIGKTVIRRVAAALMRVMAERRADDRRGAGKLRARDLDGHEERHEDLHRRGEKGEPRAARARLRRAMTARAHSAASMSSAP
jgi:hypothetical protein